ncbi:MAG: PEP-CTERM sorting domain-containing protein [Phycisphaeraceae bacterium]
MQSLSFRCIGCAAVLLVLVAGARPATAIDATWIGGTDVWSGGAAWSITPDHPDNGQPNPGDLYNVTINDGETTLDGGFTVDEFILDGTFADPNYDGVLTGTGTGGAELTVNNAMIWRGGAIAGTDASDPLVINVESTFLLDANNNPNASQVFVGFAAAEINLNGTSTWASGNILSVEGPEGGTFNNAGTFNIEGGSLFWGWGSTQIPVFNNLSGATLNKLDSGDPGDLTELYAAVNNDGQVNVDFGHLWLEGGGTSAGSFNVADGATLSFSDWNAFDASTPTTTLDEFSVVDSAGTVQFLATSFGDIATADINGQYDSAHTVVAAGETGVARVNSGATFNFTTVGDLTVNSGTIVFQNQDTSYITTMAINPDTVSQVLVRDFSTLEITGGDVVISGNGVLQLGDDTTFGALVLTVDGAQITSDGVNGGGTIVLGDTDGAGSVTLATNSVITSEMLIEGGGGSVSGAAGAVNQGTIRAQTDGLSISILSLANAGTIEGINGGGIFFSNSTNNTTGTVQVADGGNLGASGATNQGMFAISGGGVMTLGGVSFTNAATGIVNITDSTLNLFAGTWSNQGQINLIDNDSGDGTITTANLGGTFTTAGIGTINRSGAGTTDVNITGTLTNTTLALNAATGDYTLRGGTISGGNVTATGGASFVIKNGTLDGVTLDDTPLFAQPNIASVPTLSVRNLTLNNANLDLSVGGTTSGLLSFFGTTAQTLAGTGTITLGPTSSISNSASPAVTLAPGIIITGRAGTVQGGTHGIINQGTITADNQSLGAPSNFNLSHVINQGLINVRNGSVTQVDSGWSNAAGTIAVQDATLRLGGTFTPGDIGTITRSGATSVFLVGTLTNTTNNLDLQNTTGTLLLNFGTIVGGTVSSSGAASLRISSSTVGTNATLNGVTLATDLTFDTASTLGITNGLTLQNADIDLNGFGRTIIFQGASAQALGGTGSVLVSSGIATNTISNNSSAPVTFGPNVSFVGSGFGVNYNGGAQGFVNQGLIHNQNGSSMLTRVTNQGAVRVDLGATTTINTFYQQTAGLTRVDGTLVANVELSIQGGTLGGTGFIQIANAVAPLGVNVTNGGILAPGNSIGTLTVDGNVTIGDGGRVVVELSGAGDADLLSIVKGQFQPANGDLNLTSADDYLDIVSLGGLVVGNEYVIATYVGTRTGMFNHVTAGYQVFYDDPNKQVIITPIPEPASVLLLALGGAAYGLRRPRKQRRRFGLTRSVYSSSRIITRHRGSAAS